MNDHIIQIDKSLCTGCCLCVRDCPETNIGMADKKAFIIGQSCMKCGHCVAICPEAAVSMGGFEEKPVEFEKQTVPDCDDLLEALRTRRSIRHFKDKEVQPEIIFKIIEAGRLTPTAKNTQNVSYIVIKDKKAEYEKLAVGFLRMLRPIIGIFSKQARNAVIDDDFFFKKAPVAIAVVSNHTLNGGLAASNMALMAESCGLGVLFSGYFSFAANRCGKLRRALGLSGKGKVVATLVLGYASIKYCRGVQREKALVRYL